MQHIYAVRNKARRTCREGKSIRDVLVHFMQEDLPEKRRNRMPQLRLGENKTESAIALFNNFFPYQSLQEVFAFKFSLAIRELMLFLN